jgi:acetyl esterase
MSFTTDADLRIEEITIAGHAQPIQLRHYSPTIKSTHRPIIVYLHGGRFSSGSLDDAYTAASTLALTVDAWVISVGYSLAPDFPFPTALEDGYLALKWAVANADAKTVDTQRIGLAGHDAGGNLATGISAMARDRNEVDISAQALLAPLLDPSMTLLAEDTTAAEADRLAYASCYRAYLPSVMQRLHPYAAPIESRRLAGLPTTLIATAKNDCMHIEAEEYAAALIAVGITTEFKQHRHVSHDEMAAYPEALQDVAAFFRKYLFKAQATHSAR